MNGFLARVKEEILFLLEHDYDGKYSGLKEVGFYVFPESESIKFYEAWLGGSLSYLALDSLLNSE
jgi:hypothetical protein